MSSTKTKVSGGEDGTWAEVFPDPGRGVVFVTVARGDDEEDDERVAELGPRAALHLAEELIRFVRKTQEGGAEK